MISPQRQVGEGRKFIMSLLALHCFLRPGEHLQICPQEYTCCSSETEQKLIRDAEVTFRGLVEDSGSFLIHTLAARHRKFNGEDLWGSPDVLQTSLG